MKAKKDLKKKLKPVAKKTAAPVNAKKETAQKAVKKAVKPAAKKAVNAVVNKVQKAEKIVKKAVKKVEKKAVAAVKKEEEAIKKAVKKVAAKVTKPQKPAETNTAAKKAVKEESETLTQAEIKEIEIHLLALREEVRARIKNKKEHEMPETEAGDEADVASQSLDKEVLFELNDNSQAMLDQIESALRRINKGIYGTCEYCRCKIPKKRILALPFARYCIRCQTSNEGIKR